jgi:hypothetical protein
LRPGRLCDPPNLLSKVYGAEDSLPGEQRPERQADHSLPTSAEIKGSVDLYVHSPIRIHGAVLSYVKRRDNFTFTL